LAESYNREKKQRYVIFHISDYSVDGYIQFNEFFNLIKYALMFVQVTGGKYSSHPGYITDHDVRRWFTEYSSDFIITLNKKDNKILRKIEKMTG
jgi:hypothetical protein